MGTTVEMTLQLFNVALKNKRALYNLNHNKYHSKNSFLSPSVRLHYIRLFVSFCVPVSYMCDRTVTEIWGAVEWGFVNMCQWHL